MPSGTASALTVVRVARGQPRPDEAVLRDALARDRERLHLPSNGISGDMGIAGPYPILIDGRELDEYVVWER